MWYGNNRAIDSPYRDGAKNLRYASPNYVSNAVFYDQTSNLSVDKNEMYKTTAQRYFTPQKNRLQNNSSLDKTQKWEYYSPFRHMMKDKITTNELKKSKLAIKYDGFNKDSQKAITDNYLIHKSHCRSKNMNMKNISNIPWLSKTQSENSDSKKVFANHNDNEQRSSPQRVGSSKQMPIGKPPIYTSPSHNKNRSSKKLYQTSTQK